MICSFKVTIRAFWALLTCTSLCNAYAGLMGEAVFVKESNPEVVHMVTTYVPQYLSRNGNGMGICRVGRYFLGEKSSNIRFEEIPAMDGLRQCIIKRRTMKDDEYRGFTKMIFFFDAERKLIYKIAIERQFPSETPPRDRMAVINGIIDDCRQGYRLRLIRTFADASRLVYHGTDEDLEVSLELHKIPNGLSRLVLSVVNKKILTCKSLYPGEGKVNYDENVEIQL